MVDRTDAAALRVGPTTILVRVDLQDDLVSARPVVEDVLAAEGFSCFDCMTAFWLLRWPSRCWACDCRVGTSGASTSTRHSCCLRVAAVGDEWNPVLATAPPTLPRRDPCYSGPAGSLRYCTAD